MLELLHVRHRAGRALLLDDVSLTFPAGRVNVLLGPNGAGKTTLLKVAAGLVRPTEGVVRYEGQPVDTFEAGALARKRAVLSQHVALPFPLPVEEVVLMGRYPHFGRAPSASDLEIVEAAMREVGLTAKRAQPYHTLSGGEQQKTQFARVLAQLWPADGGPHRYLFLDEPTSSLDVGVQLDLLHLVRTLAGPSCTVVAVLHDLNVALEFGDAFFMLAEGRLAGWADAPEALPSTLLEAVFGVQATVVAQAEGGRPVFRFVRSARSERTP